MGLSTPGTLTPAEIVLLGIDPLDPDTFRFSVLTDFYAGTKISFGDSSGAIFTYTAPAALSANTIVTLPVSAFADAGVNLAEVGVVAVDVRGSKLQHGLAQLHDD